MFIYIFIGVYLYINDILKIDKRRLHNDREVVILVEHNLHLVGRY